jgi:hypothetical protein
LRIVETLCLCLSLALLAGHVQAQQVSNLNNIIYAGGGTSSSDDTFVNDNVPWSIGYMHQVSGKSAVLGFDLAGEGMMLDSTWGQSQEPAQGFSMNLLIGTNMIDDGHLRANAALLIGMRETAAACPASYLGYQCYADSDPTVEYQANVGAVLTLSFDSLTLGLRATGESSQVLFGIRF